MWIRSNILEISQIRVVQHRVEYAYTVMCMHVRKWTEQSEWWDSWLFGIQSIDKEEQCNHIWELAS